MTTITKPERHAVHIETEMTGRISMTPAQFDMLLAAALIGLEEHPFEGDAGKAADSLYNMISAAAEKHAGK